MLYITRRERFSAAHRLFNPNLSQDQNLKEYGKCANEFFHGHNYKIFVTVKGQIKPDVGYVMDMKKLSQIIKTQIIELVDHKNLNIDVDFLKNINPSTENLLIQFWGRLAPEIEKCNCKLHKLKLIETENNYGEYYGE
ncbi:MAG: 6-carboxytetrahydropterin synthase [Bacteroidales bacterium]|nr:6-carboxytetrahydropterin synthase [Bacteroidales bacterium]